MRKRKPGKAKSILNAVIIAVAALVTAVIADDKKEIPDHSAFDACQACHAEKHAMWESTGHGKAVRLVAVNQQGATDCGGCHSPRSNEAKQSDTAVAGAQNAGPHKISCLACHARQKTEYDHRLLVDPEQICSVCHMQRPIFWGLGAKGITDLRNFHSGVPCVSCHMTEGNHRMKVLRPDDPGLTEKRLDTCTACHKDNNREARVRQLNEYQLTYDENMAPLLADVKAIDEALKKKPNLLNADLRSKLTDVKANLSIMEKDGSRGFHNFVFMLEVTANAASDLKKIKAAVK